MGSPTRVCVHKCVCGQGQRRQEAERSQSQGGPDRGRQSCPQRGAGLSPMATRDTAPPAPFTQAGLGETTHRSRRLLVRCLVETEPEGTGGTGRLSVQPVRVGRTDLRALGGQRGPGGDRSEPRAQKLKGGAKCPWPSYR